MFIADYMEDFKCIGSDCEDSCCAGWQVSIDKRTYKKYQKTTSHQLRPLLKKHIARNRGSAVTERGYAHIKLDSEQACPLLATTGLCQVQQVMGEKALSKTCRTYPRINTIIDSMQEVSGSVSCPEIARLALLKKEGIGFKESQLNSEGQQLSATLSTFDAKDNTPSKHFWTLQMLSIEILKNRQTSLWKRLLILGFICRKIDESDDDLNSEYLEKTVHDYTSFLNDPEYNQNLDNLPSSLNLRLGLIKETLKVTEKRSKSQPRFGECRDLFVDYLHANGETPEAVEQQYQAALENNYQPFMDEHEYILENYLVNNVFQTLFPARPTKKTFENYMTLVISYTVIRLHLIGMAGAMKGKLDSKMTIQLIQSFSKMVEHNSKLLQSIRQYFKNNKFDQMSHMSILLKDGEKSTTSV